MSHAEELLSATLTFRDSALRRDAIPTQFSSATEARSLFQKVLLHEAHLSLKDPLSVPPQNAYLHVVDVDTSEPGIYDSKHDPGRILRKVAEKVPRLVYSSLPKRTPPPPLPTAKPVPLDHEEAVREAEEAAKKELLKAERAAATKERRARASQEAKEARARETPEEREARLQEAREKRAASKAKRERAKEEGEQEPQQERRVGAGGTGEEGDHRNVEEEAEGEGTEGDHGEEEGEWEADSSARSIFMEVQAPKRRRKKGEAAKVFESPIPHHRHLCALQKCDPRQELLSALLTGEECDDLEIIQGPPGTGKTHALVDRLSSVLPRDKRAFLCAPTNVGAANLYARCVASGWSPKEVSLVLAPGKVPPGTCVHSTDPEARLVCSTISARAGRQLDDQSFEILLVDEAAQCMEAWLWGLLRAEVETVVLAGDVQQLPALTSEEGRALRHDRSLMERLVVDLDYGNVVQLRVQHRMAPELLAFPNRAFYDGVLSCGVHAPLRGSFEVVRVEDACEEADGTSWLNRKTAAAAAAAAKEAKEGVEVEEEDKEEGGSVVLLAPYVAQCRLLLAEKTGCEVHTVDSFQGREADTVVLDLVRDGTQGLGFWEDARRLTVAMTRAKTRLVLVVSSSLFLCSYGPIGELLSQSTSSQA